MIRKTRILIIYLAKVLAVLAAGSHGVNHFQIDEDTNHTQQTRFKPQHPERGYVGNCAGGFYNISWEPKDISPADRIKFYANFVSPVDMDQINVVGAVWYEGRRLVAINQRYTCQELVEQLAQYFPRNVPRIHCPIRKGQLVTGMYLYTDTEILMGYDGFYDLHVNVKDTSGQDLMCIDLKVTVLPSDY